MSGARQMKALVYLGISLFVAARCESQVDNTSKRQLARNTCAVFSHPERFIDQTITIEAIVETDTKSHDLHASQILGPPKLCGIQGRFWYVPPDKEKVSEKPDRDFLRFLEESRPMPEGAICSECPRYRVTHLITRGKLVRVRDRKQTSGIEPDFDQIGAPIYSLRILQVLEVEAEEIKYD
jgi:hypothetical protein